MRHGVRDALAVTVLVVGAVCMLGGCAGESADQPTSPSTTQTEATQPEGTQPSNAPDQTDTLPPSATTGSAPLGLEIRYVDENGRFVTVSPEDFPR